MSPRPRPLDHCVLPVPDLAAARARYEALGFTVAPDGIHPFGTANACVHFADGTFLEPLAVRERDAYETAVSEANAFVIRDRAFRYRNGDCGFSGLVFGTGDAKADHRAFRGAGLSAGERLRFSRAFRTPDGARGKASFRLAFAADPRAPDAFFFTCERVRVPKVDRSALVTHPNGVTGTSAVVMSAARPADFATSLAALCGVAPSVVEGGMSFDCGNGRVLVLDDATLAARYGVQRSASDGGLRLAGIVLSVADAEVTSNVLRANGIKARKRPSALVVAPAPGQGAFIAFS